MRTAIILHKLPLTRAFAALLIMFSGMASLPAAETTLLNVSYDVTREFYQDYNAAFCQILEGEDR